MTKSLTHEVRRSRGGSIVTAGVLLAVAAAFALPAVAQAQTQAWEYKSYRKDRTTGKYDMNNFISGSIVLEEKDGSATFKMLAGFLDVCYSKPLPAQVTRTEKATLIEVTQPVTGCEQFRYTIRNDGSGGTKETREGDGPWRKDRFDHGLTPKAP